MPRFLQFLLAASALSLASASDIAAACPHLMALRWRHHSDLSMPQQAVAMMASVGVRGRFAQQVSCLRLSPSLRTSRRWLS